MPEELFNLPDNDFSFESHGVILSVHRLHVPGFVAFHVKFSSNRKPITIARATDFDSNKFWTTIPEGQNRENEAKGVGKLIEEYLKNQKDE